MALNNASLVLTLAIGVGLGYFIGNHSRVTKEDDDEEEDSNSSEDSSGDEGDEEESEEDEDERLKMVLLVRTDLKSMRPGKKMAQCAHASLMGYQKIMSRYKRAKGKGDAKELELRKLHKKWVKRWDITGCAKIALKCPSQEMAVKLEAAARAAGLPTVKVVDAGRTQIPAGTMTVVGIGPAPQDKIDEIAGELKLM